MFHKHQFQKDGNNLWCTCGKLKELNCNHNWKVHSSVEITNQNITKGFQTQQILVCNDCGILKSVNITTGIID